MPFKKRKDSREVEYRDSNRSWLEKAFGPNIYATWAGIIFFLVLIVYTILRLSDQSNEYGGLEKLLFMIAGSFIGVNIKK